MCFNDAGIRPIRFAEPRVGPAPLRLPKRRYGNSSVFFGGRVDKWQVCFPRKHKWIMAVLPELLKAELFLNLE